MPLASYRINSLSAAAAAAAGARVTNSTFTASGSSGTTTGKFNDGLSAGASTTRYRVKLGTGAGGQFYFNTGSQWTLEFWMQVTGVYNANANAWGFDDVNQNLRLEYFQSQNTWKLLYPNGNTITNLSFTTNTWYNFVIQSNGSDQIKIWRNGSLQANNVSVSMGNIDSFYMGYLGSASSGSVVFDEVRVSNTQLYPSSSPTTATAEYTNGANTIALFHCESTTQTDDTTS